MELREGINRMRPEIRAMGSHGGTYFLDITFVSALAPSSRRINTFNPLTFINGHRAAKRRKYRPFIATSSGCRLVPMRISSLVGWHLD